MPLSKNGKYYSDKKKPSQREIEGALNLLAMCKKSPHLKTLIDTFDLRTKKIPNYENSTDHSVMNDLIEHEKQVKQTNKKPMSTTQKKAVISKSKSDKKEVIYPEGIRFFKPNAKAPDFVLAEGIINVDLLCDWLKNSEDLTREHEEYGKQIKVTIKQSDKNGVTMVVNTFGLD